ncbi:MAG: hypothetical protein J1E78_00340 [Muribaculaceae bacterium]|nr:hypothetical protein [Muribaculaceae bacterium]
MAKYYDNTYSHEASGFEKNPKKKLWLLLLKIFCWFLGIVGVLIIGFCIGVSLYLTPDRLARLIGDKSEEYLDGKIEVKAAEYTFFSTFPWLYFEADSIRIMSKSFPSVPLGTIVALKGGINVRQLITGKVELKDVEINSPSVNLYVESDTEDNFDIFPKIPRGMKIPQISVNNFRINPPIELSYSSVPDSLEAKATMDSFYLENTGGLSYKFGFDGTIAGCWKNYNLNEPIPVSMNTTATLRYNDFLLNLENLRVVIGDIKAELQGNIEADSEKLRVENFDLNLKIANVFNLMGNLAEFLPSGIEIPKGIEGYLPLELNCKILNPLSIEYSLLKNGAVPEIPAIEATLNITDASLGYIPPYGKEIRANDVMLNAVCEYNPDETEKSFVEISNLRLGGEGISLELQGRLDNLNGETQVVKGHADFSSHLMETLSYLLPISDFKVKGNIAGNVSVNCALNDLGRGGVSNIEMRGDIKSKYLSAATSSNKNLLIVDNLRSAYIFSTPEYPVSTYKDSRIKLEIDASKLSGAPLAGSSIEVGQFNLNLDLADTTDETDPAGNLIFSSGVFNVESNTGVFEGSGLKLKAQGHLNSSPVAEAKSTYSNNESDDGKIIAERVAHTPLYLEYQGGGMIQTITNLATLNAELTLTQGRFKSSAYLYPIDFKGLSVVSNLNDIEFSVSRIGVSHSALSMSGNLKGLRGFLNSPDPVLLKADANINFDNVDINELSWGYYGTLIKSGEKDALAMPGKEPYNASDSICVAIPRNIEAQLRLRSQSAEYMGYKFSPLSTDILVKNGDATLSRLTIGTPYCTAEVDWTYSTTRLDNIFMDLKADIRNFSFTPFYSVFPEMISKAPELKDLSGFINAGVNCRFLMYPDMFMNSRSLEAKFEIDGTGLNFARQGKIERFTHLMLIKGDEPIHLSNLHITGGFHDNILQVNPFKLQFGGYQIGIAGINNIKGDMYYHLALEKSPFHLPFGVNLKGSFQHPEVRLGGTHIDEDESERISSDLGGDINVNIMAWLRRGWQMFLKAAAKYEMENNGKKPLN